MDKKKKRKLIGRQAKEREVLIDYVGEEVTLSGIYTKTNSVISSDFIGKSILFKNIKFKEHDIQHIWIHYDAIKNLSRKLTYGDLVVLKGTVYSYTHSYRGRLLSVKYSLKDVEILN